MSLSVLHRRHAQQHQHDALIDSLAFIHSSFIEHAAQVPYPTTLTVLDLHSANLQLHTIYDPCLSRSYLEGSRWRITQKSSHSHSHDGSVYNITFSNSSNFKLVSSAQMKGSMLLYLYLYLLLYPLHHNLLVQARELGQNWIDTKWSQYSKGRLITSLALIKDWLTWLTDPLSLGRMWRKSVRS